MIDAWIDEDDPILCYDEEGNVLSDDQCYLCHGCYVNRCVACQLNKRGVYEFNE